MKTAKFIQLLSLALYSQQLLASVSFSFEFEAFRDSSGIPLSTETYAVLIADTNKDSIFPSASDLLGAELNVGDDIQGNRVFFSGSTSNSIFQNNTGSLNGSDLGLDNNSEISGTKWAVYWFPGLSSAPGVSGLQSGQSYGSYHSDQIDAEAAAIGATAAMVMPADGSNVIVMYFDTETEATTFPSVQDFTADLTVVPEPSTVALIGLVSLVFILRRRQ